MPREVCRLKTSCESWPFLPATYRRARKRGGKNQTTTAMTILMHLPQDQQAAAALSREVRRLLLQQFDSLHPYDQEYLMRQYWEHLRDPALIPSLKKMLASNGMASKNIHEAALKR